MSDSEVDYLQDGFNPQSLTVPRLRSILVTYSINYPATAKKPQLVDLFNDYVAPQAKKILAQRARAKRSSMGIVDANPSQSASTDDFDDHEDLLPPQPAPRARSPRKSTRSTRPSEEPEAMPELRSPRKRATRSASRQLSEPETTDTDAPSRQASRRLRSKAPQITEETTDEEVEYSLPVTRVDAVFTSDNPFQSGASSSPAPIKTPSNRRRTTGTEERKTGKDSALRRRTDGPSETKFSKTFEIPIEQFKAPMTPEPETDLVEAGEEFTPDAQLELAQEEAAQGARAVLARRRPARAKKGPSLTTPLWVLAFTLLSAYGAWYRQEKIAVGYCGVGRSAKPFIPSSIGLPGWVNNIEVPEVIRDIQLPEWAHVNPELSDLPEWAQVVLEPQCEPCPPHAYCYEDFTVRCENDYLLKAHPLSLGGLIPLPPTCEPDGEKARRVEVVADKAVEELRDRKAKFECGELVDEEGKQVESPAVEEEVLKEAISEKRNKRLTMDEFEDLWGAAIGEVEAREEVEIVYSTRSPGSVPTRRISSTSHARVPLSCALRLSIRDTIARYRLHVSILVLAALASLYGRGRYQSHRSTAAQIPALVDLVLERLSSQKELSYEAVADGANEEDPFLFLPNLRDDVLRATHSLAQRDRIWQRVRAVVEQNSNVRTGQREGHNGEVGRAWEWIGPSAGAIEGSARRRRSARVSWGADVKSEEDEDLEALKPAKQEMSEDRVAANRKWQESRPIY